MTFSGTREVAAASPRIRLARLSKSFGERGFVLREVTLDVTPESFVSVIGASGSGKTTLLKTINRLTEPDSGTLQLDGVPIDSVPAHELRRRIGYVFQQVGLFPHMSVAENIAITPRLLKWPEPQIAARVLELIELVGLPEIFLSRMPDQLSGGQRQRVGVARALAARPAIVLLDEPFGALDAVTREVIGDEYRKLHEQMNLTTIMITHDVLEAVLLSDRVIVMRQGSVVADGAPRELLAGHADAGVRELMEMPRRQAERVRALLGEDH